MSDFKNNFEAEGTVVINGCARCGERKHPDVVKYKFTKPAGEYTHFAFCPNNQQPILIKITAQIK